MSRLRWLPTSFAVALGLAVGLLAAPRVAHAQVGTISGRVIDEATGAPVASARVVVVGTTLAALTNEEGRYILRAVPPGRVELRVQLIGHSAPAQTFTLAPGAIETVDFALAKVAIALDELVVTATGELARRGVAHSVTRIDVSRVVEEAQPTNLTQLLSGRAAGVQVLPSGGTTGGGTRVRVRGSQSVSLSNEPILIVDGVRIEQDVNSLSVGTGGQSPSRLNDINPENIESIEIIRGPAAAAQYGTNAANGVIQITTKQGRPGRARWNFYTEQGAVVDNNDYPANWTALRAATGTVGGRPATDFPDDPARGLFGSQRCATAQTAAAIGDLPQCDQTNLFQFNPLLNSRTSPLKSGHRQKYGFNVSGGTEVTQYFVSAEWEGEDGVLRLPGEREPELLERLGELRDTRIRPNALERVNVRTNLTTQLRDDLDLSVHIGYVTSSTTFPQNDNNVTGVHSSAFLGYWHGEDTPLADSLGFTFNDGYGFFRPDQVFGNEREQLVDRFTTSVQANYTPFPFLSIRGVAGLDLTQREDLSLQMAGDGTPFGISFQGSKSSNRFKISHWTADFSGTAQFALTDRIGSRTTGGLQFLHDLLTATFGTGQRLIPGSTSINSAADVFLSEQQTQTKRFAFVGEQQFDLDQRLFVTAALRVEDNSRFGGDVDPQTYPSVGVTWTALERPYQLGPLDVSLLRLRAAWGRSGLQPGVTDALRFFDPVTVTQAGADQSGVTLANIGDPGLKPERSSEVEVGFDAGLWDGRVGVELSYYNNTTRDALVDRRLAPSLGATSFRLENIGETNNRGIEAALNVAVLETRQFRWESSLNASLNRNRLVKLGEGVEPVIFGLGGDSQRHEEGFSLGGYWSQTVDFNDANGDGIITPDELTISEEPEFVGHSQPRYQVTWYNAVSLGRSFRLSGLFDYRGGHKLFNATEEFRCNFSICEGLFNPNAPLEQQAAALARRPLPGETRPSTRYGLFIEDAWFIKLRELSLTYFLPDNLARSMRAERVSVTVTGRNLLTITDYTGLDPEVNQFGQNANFGVADFLTLPPVTYWTARVNISF